MKHQISVSIFLAILVLALTWLYIKFYNETKPEESDIATEQGWREEPATTISQDEISAPFYGQEESGKLVIYRTETGEIYMETSIVLELLPLEVQQRIQEKIYFQTEQELYDFLESYSS